MTGSRFGVPVIRNRASLPGAKSGFDGDDFAAVVEAAGPAQVVRQLQLTAVRAFLELGRGQRVMAATHVAAGRRGLALGNGHEAPVSINLKAVVSAPTQCVLNANGHNKWPGQMPRINGEGGGYIRFCLKCKQEWHEGMLRACENASRARAVGWANTAPC